MGQISNELTNALNIKEIGKRLKEYRLAENMSREEMSSHSGVSLNTIARLEQGNSISLDNLLSIMRTLRLIDAINLTLPERKVSPVEAAEIERKLKRVKLRASTKRKPEKQTKWKWGDES